MDAVEDLDCISFKVEAHGTFGCVVDHQGNRPTIRGELIGLPTRLSVLS